jgi:glutamine amidotransferase-like uncharacterized protein
MKKYNKYLVPEKNSKLNLYDIEIVSEYNGKKVDENAIVSKIIGTKETFYIFILPNYEEKWVRMGCDSNTDFAQQVTQLMMESGEAEYLIKQVYNKCFAIETTPPATEQVSYNLLN